MTGAAKKDVMKYESLKYAETYKMELAPIRLRVLLFLPALQ